jgi:hypothetical protein
MKTNWGSLPNSKIGGSGFENSNTKQGSCLVAHILIEGMNSIIIIHAIVFSLREKDVVSAFDRLF